MRRRRSAKVVATLGPSSSRLEKIRALFEAGVDVFRLNFSHGIHEDHRARFEAIRYVERATGRPIGVLADLQGPKLRLGTFAEGRIEIVEAVHPGTELLLDDGKVRLQVESCGASFADTLCLVGGPLSDRKGVNVP